MENTENIEEISVEETEEEDNSYESQPTIFDELAKYDKDEIIKIMEKAKTIQRLKKVHINDEVAQAKKGKFRNQICPLCGKKTKKCKCDYSQITDRV